MQQRLLVLIICLLALGTTVVHAQDTPVMATLYQTVNVRGGPDTRYEIVGQVSAGDSVYVLGRAASESRWLQVELPDGIVGWVASYLLIIESDPSLLPVVDAGEDDAGDTRVTITAYGAVNVRGGPSILQDIIDQLDVGDQAQVLARSNERNDWLYIENASVAGWVAYFTVDVQGNPNQLPLRVPDVSSNELIHPTQLIRARFNIRLRAEPSLGAPVVGIVDFDGEVTPLARDEDGAWLYVAAGELAGWAAASLFETTRDAIALLPLYSADAAVELGSLAQSVAEPTPEPAASTAEPAVPAPEATEPAD